MTDSNWQQAFNNELDQALAARKVGNEGRARVCARRAVGILIGEYLSQKGITGYSDSALDRIKFLVDAPGISQEIRDVAGYFLVRVEPDHSLPIDVDLISEAHWLEIKLLQKEGEG